MQCGERPRRSRRSRRFDRRLHAARLGRQRPAAPAPGLDPGHQLGHPATRGIQAAREIASGASVGDRSHLLAGEAATGAIDLVVGFSLLRLFEYEGQRTATLETF